MFCTTEGKDFEVQGDFYRENFQYIEIKLFKCFGTTIDGEKCASDQEINDYFDNEAFSFAYVNTFFDFFNFVTPVKYFIDDSLFFELESTKIKKTNLFIKRSEAELAEDLV